MLQIKGTEQAFKVILIRVITRVSDPDPGCPERLDPDPNPVNIRPDPKPW